MDTERPWFANYPKGIGETVDVNTYRSLVEVVEEAFERFAQQPAFRNFGRILNYAELDRLSQHFASYLTNELKLEKGDRIAIMLPNVLQYPVVLFGAMRAGLTVVNTNPMYTARELGHQLNDSGAVAIIVLENFASTLEKVLAETSVKHVITTAIGDMLGCPKGPVINFILRRIKKMVPPFHLPEATRFKHALKRGKQHAYTPVDITHDDVVFLQYTGGTTGVAKGAMLTHRNMIANMLQAGMWIEPQMSPGKEVIITALPLYHIFSLTANGLVFMRLGGLNHLITNPRDMPNFVKELRHSGLTAITGVNTLFNGLLNTPGFADIDFSKLSLSLGGGSAIQHVVAERWEATTGCTMTEAYGLTETAPAVCINPLGLGQYNGSIGLPLPSTDVAIWSDDGKRQPYNETGELMVRGPQVMKGYWNRPKETDNVLTAEGWLHTGDIARMDEGGFIYIVDRKKDMILVSGFNVYPNEVEDIVIEHPKVAEVAAIGAADEHSGEVVKLYVVKKDHSLTEAELNEFCRDKLTGYKHPKAIEFLDHLPKSNVGKVLRRSLREQ